MDAPEGWRPVVTLPITLGGAVARSSTCTKDSGTQFVGFAASSFSEFAISASRRSGVMAMLDGGPITELGISFR